MLPMCRVGWVNIIEVQAVTVNEDDGPLSPEEVDAKAAQRVDRIDPEHEGDLWGNMVTGAHKQMTQDT